MASRPTRRRAASIFVFALACLAAPAAAQALPPATPGKPTAAAASAALAAAAGALEAQPGSPPEHGATAALAALADALPALSGRERRRGEALLARPTDGRDDQFGDGYSGPGGHLRHTESPEGNFCVTWVISGADAPDRTDTNGNGTPDYIGEVAAIAALSYAVQVDELGWIPPKPDRREECGEPGQTDIYVKDVGDAGLFGYTATDPGQGNARTRYGYLVIDNDYDLGQYDRFDEPRDAARVTIAHELNHLLHEAYSSRQDPWMFEATATWMEEKVYPELNDYLHYVPRFARTPGASLTSINAGGGFKPYGAALWNHWLENGDRRYGASVVRAAWEVSGATTPRDFALGAYGRAISDAGGVGVAREFVDFAAATAEWRTGVGGFPDAAEYPDVRREGTLRAARRRDRAFTLPRPFRLDHAAYRLLRVPGAGTRRIRLGVRAQRGVRSGLALVARSGGATDGEVVRKVKFMPRGGRGSVALPHPWRYQRITAVIVNADARVRGYSFRRGGWRYRRNEQRFRARLIR